MPIYVYFCEECGKELKALHSIKEKYTSCQEIEDCDIKGQLKRLPSNFSAQYKKQEKEQKVGSLVKDFIEETREELKGEKETLRNQEYEE
jgi:putative FmdB family regulatory protein